jgi:aspartokinase
MAAAGVRTAGIATSSFRITWLVDRDRVSEAVRTLHTTFIATDSPI